MTARISPVANPVRCVASDWRQFKFSATIAPRGPHLSKTAAALSWRCGHESINFGALFPFSSTCASKRRACRLFARNCCHLSPRPRDATTTTTTTTTISKRPRSRNVSLGTIPHSESRTGQLAAGQLRVQLNCRFELRTHFQIRLRLSHASARECATTRRLLVDSLCRCCDHLVPVGK